MRACAIKVDEVVGVAGFVTPVCASMSWSPATPRARPTTATAPKVRTVLQNIEVLSAGTDIQKDDAGKPQSVRVVNLLVTPEQAEVLSLASGLSVGGNQGHIQLVLRNPLDTEIGQVAGTGVAQLFSGPAAPTQKALPGPVVKREPRPAPPVYSIVVYNGSQRSEQKFVSAEGNQ